MATSQSRQDFLVSIRPQYVDKILAGKKTVELRRRFPESVSVGAVAYIYSSSPVQAVVGCAKIKEVQRLAIADIWKEHAEAACISRRDFYDYFSGAKFGFAILLGTVKAMRQQVTARELESQFGIVPPQSYRYVTDRFISLFDDEPFQTTHRHSRSHRAGRPKAGRSAAR
ncbi:MULTISPECIES: ASCH domain-containing protein [unclassified Bradyrhizobium]|uniref:ASCH domain-containing protein n=1 Tax=unclassified Bradyrhizobium TaxID=2631580 RepID=UPI001FFB6054|nr:MULTISPECIES: ASCH domain-containing protein [unclassified Bradyrhizobium]MCK1266883.1 ASCH domain-containing protein [Bradyrhizobium sp. 84]MCK1369737.1 ASCH domain-containing protein [Bradyrhizobium sp. 49]MCK1430656.1 ASCH domain-containing protein [Bradyrhizobium sp. 87]